MKTFKELNESGEINEAIDELIHIARALDVSLDMAKVIVALAGITGMATLAIVVEKIQDIVSKKDPKLAAKLGELAKGAAAGRK